MFGNHDKVKIYYVASGDVLKGRVEPIIWMRTCEWLTKRGFDVTLVTFYFYRNDNIALRDIRSHFGVSTVFGIRILPALLSTLFSSPNWVRLNYSVGLVLYFLPLFILRRKFVIYSKLLLAMQIVMWMERVFRHDVTKVSEQHVLHSNNRTRTILQHLDLLVVNCRAVANRAEELGVPSEKILVAYNGPFGRPSTASKDEARGSLGLASTEDKLVFFTGKIVESQLEFLLSVAERLQHSPFQFHVVGGNPEILRKAHVSVRTKKLTKVFFHGFQAPSRIGLYLRAADFLLSVYDNRWPAIEQATPAKLFDYMLSERPIFCSDNTAIGELFVHKKNCFFFSADSVNQLATSLLEYGLANDAKILDAMCRRNKALARKVSWSVRSRLIGSRLTSTIQLRFRSVDFTSENRSS